MMERWLGPVVGYSGWWDAVVCGIQGSVGFSGERELMVRRRSNRPAANCGPL